MYFPHDSIRREQQKLINDVERCLSESKNLIAHAPTGLGKTAASLAPALKYAEENDCTIFFLTSRHTQHAIALETLKKIKERFNLDFGVADIIGKKHMCALPGVETLYSSDFSDFCRKMKEDNKCENYANTRKNSVTLTVQAETTLHQIRTSIKNTAELVDIGVNQTLCPYELAVELSKTARVVICDYYYLFNPAISDAFFAKIGKGLEKSIIIVDEAHNLPDRLRDFATQRLSGLVMKNAIKEAKKYEYSQTLELLVKINDIINSFVKRLGMNREMIVKKEELLNEIEKISSVDHIIKDLLLISESIREQQKRSFIASVARFLDAWRGGDEGFSRILSLQRGSQESYYLLSYKCLDPSVVAAPVINEAHSTIIMSGTLTPTEMYGDLLGVDNRLEREYKSEFPLLNRLDMVVPLTTTKYSKRSEQQFIDIAQHCAKMTDAIKGNVLIFFPSYYLKDQVYRHFAMKTSKTVLQEISGMTKDDKHQLLEKFKEYKEIGSVMLAVTSGSFGEGVDLPGDLLNGVIVVGLPLGQPDLETKELIRYFDEKYSQGWNYGYIYPAFQKCLQNAGRCIRSEKDKGVIIYLDERYILPMYYRCFPEELEMEVTRDYLPEIREFFGMF